MRIIGVYFLMTVLFSCSKNSEVENIYTIPEEFRLDLTQVLSESGALPAFRFTTIDKIGCSGQELKTEYYKKSNNAFINIIGIEIVEQCPLPDYMTSEISDSFTEGLYNFMVQVKNEIENQGTFSVRPDHYSLNMHDAPNVVIGETKILKLPTDCWWGAIYSSPNYSPENLNNLKSIIDGNTDPYSNLTQGNYGLFIINNSEKIIIDDLKEYNGYLGFCVKKNMDQNNFLNKINEFLSQNEGTHMYLASNKEILLDR